MFDYIPLTLITRSWPCSATPDYPDTEFFLGGVGCTQVLEAPDTPTHTGR